MATASEDGTARIWAADAFEGPRMLRDPKLQHFGDGAFSPDGRYLATAHVEFAAIWETATGKQVHQLGFTTPSQAGFENGRGRT